MESSTLYAGARRAGGSPNLAEAASRAAATLRSMRHVMALAALVGLGVVAACGSDSPAEPPPDGGPGPDATTTVPPGPGPDGGPGDAGPSGPRVEVKGGELVIDGRPTVLYGGDVPYFRVRDKGYDAAKTHAMWADTFAKMKQANMNTVGSYFPWDYHETAAGTWDFAGARDAKKFLELACQAGMKVVAKPGPLITAEWPKGFGTFGAVPAWWKAAHPGSLVKKANGDTFNFSPTGDATQTQPTFLDRDYLAAVGAWYDKVLPILTPFIASRCVVAVQIDNETNQYWANRYGDVDYSAPSLQHYRAFLERRYGGNIARLNTLYGTTYAAFANVTPPSDVPKAEKDNVAARDWYEAGQAYSLEYLKTLRQMIEARGIREPDVMFFTNDSPFGLPLRNVLVHDAAIKNQVGLCGTDLYPKQFPTNGEIVDQPFQVDYFTKLYGEGGKLYTRDAQRYTFGAELQGGFYSFPLGIKPEVSPEATDQLLAKSFGHGMKGGSFYVLRGGYNLDDSSYDFQGAIGIDGALRPRFDVMKRWGTFTHDFEADFSSSEEIEDAVTVLNDGAYAVPQAGTRDDMQALYAAEYPGVFGWLVTSGFNPKVGELSRADSALAGQKAAVVIIPDMIDDAAADKLVAFHAQGGALVAMLTPGLRNLQGARSPSVQKLAALFDAQETGDYSWLGVGLRSGDTNVKLAGAEGTTKTFWHQSYFTPAAGATPLVVERTAPLGNDGRTVAFSRTGSGAPRVLFGAHFGSVFNHDSYYRADDADLTRKRALMRHVMQLAGVTPALRATGLREEAWARLSRDKKRLFVFVVSGHDAGTTRVELLDGGRLGLAPTARYTVKNALNGVVFPSKTGAELLSGGIEVPLAKHGTAALVIERAP